MTTIATDGVTMAADGLVTAEHIVEATAYRKVEQLEDGRVVGCAGVLTSCEAFRNWLRDGQGDPPELDEEFTAIVADGTREVVVYDQKCRALRLPVPYAAGSGAHLALGAMLAGKCPTEAVQIACDRDVFSGGTILTLKAESSTS
ncbi:hypothetical protein [Sphingomonas sp. G-3-2-10]|uniref:hypothetical protein n=1 Tax=Sphingomonas sp. G-3-2-10 TaxID=2728838 RepID=UPI00146F4323|nr:hypothetical protein [Sphingomonas sp. G-3-2-10]NML04281.1 hypothetical protein [Sphingomonas sp. G-3-2-10]